jgi:hypothetical protein
MRTPQVQGAGTDDYNPNRNGRRALALAQALDYDPNHVLSLVTTDYCCAFYSQLFIPSGEFSQQHPSECIVQRSSPCHTPYNKSLHDTDRQGSMIKHGM